jgi:hypothetical protein
MNDGTPTILYTKETREYLRHVRCWRYARDSQVSLFSRLSRMYHVAGICATSGKCPGQTTFVHVKRVTMRVITFHLEAQDSFHRAVPSRVDPSGRRMRLCCSDTSSDLSVLC